MGKKNSKLKQDTIDRLTTDTYCEYFDIFGENCGGCARFIDTRLATSILCRISDCNRGNCCILKQCHRNFQNGILKTLEYSLNGNFLWWNPIDSSLIKAFTNISACFKITLAVLIQLIFLSIIQSVDSKRKLLIRSRNHVNRAIVNYKQID